MENTAKIEQVKGGWRVTVNGQMYGEYTNQTEAEQIANSVRGTLAN